MTKTLRPYIPPSNNPRGFELYLHRRVNKRPFIQISTTHVILMDIILGVTYLLLSIDFRNIEWTVINVKHVAKY